MTMSVNLELPSKVLPNTTRTGLLVRNDICGFVLTIVVAIGIHAGAGIRARR